MNPAWISSKKEKENLREWTEELQKKTLSLLEKKQKLESALWFVKSMVESAITHPEHSQEVVGKVADKIEELEENSVLIDPRRKYKNADK